MEKVVSLDAYRSNLDKDDKKYLSSHFWRPDDIKSSSWGYRVFLDQSSIDWNDNYTHSLFAKPNCNLLLWDNWNDNAKYKVELKRLARYLTYDKITGKLAFARIAKTRITKFATSLRLSNVKFRDSDEFWSLNIDFDDPDLKDNIENIKFSMKSKSNHAIVIFAFFNGAQISITDVKSKFSKIDFVSDLIKSKDINTFCAELMTFMLQPFSYQHKLLGEEALSYLNEQQLGDEILLSITVFADKYFLLTADEYVEP